MNRGSVVVRQFPEWREAARQHAAAGFLLLAAVMSSPASAGDLPDVRIDAVIAGSGIARVKGPGDVASETIMLKGQRVRVDFDAGEGRRGRILRGGDHAWVLMSTSHRALPADHVKLGALVRLDPQRPCADLSFYCDPVEPREIAGRQAVGWRYRHAEQAGPDGTDSGTFWLDAEYGLVLGFSAEDLSGRKHRMEATAISFDKLPEDTFALPEALRQDIDGIESRIGGSGGKRP